MTGKNLSFVQQFVQGECAFEGAFEEVVDVATRLDAEKEGKHHKLTLKNSLTAFSNKTFVVSTTASASPSFNPATLRQTFIGGKTEALIRGRTIKELAADTYNNYKKAQSLMQQHKLLNDDGTLKSGTNTVEEVFKELLRLLLDHNDEEEPLPTEKKHNGELLVRGWMAIVLFTRHVGYMWDSGKDLDLPMLLSEDYGERQKQKNGRKAHRKKESQQAKMADRVTSTNAGCRANVNFRDQLLYAQMKSMEYENMQSEWESGVTIICMEANVLRQEISTLQFMITHDTDPTMKQQYIERMAELLNEQKRLRQSMSEHSAKRPKVEKMGVMSGTTIDLATSGSGGGYNDGSSVRSDQVSALTTCIPQS